MRLSYVLPFSAVMFLAWLGDLSWWAIAMLTGGSLFAWGWLWGDRELLNANFGLALTAAGIACLAAAWFLADGLGLSLGEFEKPAKGLRHGKRMLYLLPSMGVALTLYGVLIWSRAWLLERNKRW